MIALVFMAVCVNFLKVVTFLLYYSINAFNIAVRIETVVTGTYRGIPSMVIVWSRGNGLEP